MWRVGNDKAMLCLELFSGTGSIARAFERLGWAVVSVDINPKCKPTLAVDILKWDFTVFTRDHFDFVWASPVCTQYSKAKTVGVRDLEGADKLVSKALEIIQYFGCSLGMENPQTGLLKSRDHLVKKLPFVDTTYCKYGYSYRKATRVWSNLVLSLHTPCTLQDPCTAMVGRRHPKTAQQSRRGSDNNDKDNRCSQKELFSIPEGLCDEIADAAHNHIINDESNAGVDVPPATTQVRTLL